MSGAATGGAERAYGGPVMVDVGGGRGALVVHLDRGRLGTELHLAPLGAGNPTHTGVWERDVGGTRVVAAVYASLVEGVYAVLDADGQPAAEVRVADGEVTEIELELEPSRSGPGPGRSGPVHPHAHHHPH